MVTGLMIKHMAMASIGIAMERIILGIGKRINNMETDLKHGPMELDMKDSITKERSMEMDF